MGYAPPRRPHDVQTYISTETDEFLEGSQEEFNGKARLWSRQRIDFSTVAGFLGIICNLKTHLWEFPLRHSSGSTSE
jgi:hypothetical protein